MKKTICILLVLIIILGLIGCTPVNDPAESSTLTAQLPSDVSSQETLELTTYELPNTDGDSNRWFKHGYNYKVSGIQSQFFDAAGSDVTQNWISNYESQKRAGTLDTTYPSLVKFIKDIGLSNTICLQVAQEIEQNDKPTSPNYLTVEDMQVILTFDTKQINQRFVSAYAICVEGEIYTPHWILNHSAADYKAAGITAAQIEEKLPTYAKFLGAEHQDYTQLYTQKLNDLKALEK